MLDSLYSRFASVWCWDTEFIPVPGWRVTPVCLAATEARSGISKTFCLDHPGQRAENPLPFGSDALHIVYNAGAELSFALAMNWGLPQNVLDLWVERRNFTNNKVTEHGEFIHTGLIDTLHDYGILDTTSAETKEAMHERISAGYPYTIEEAQKILEYCRGDVAMLLALAHKMVPQIENIDQALHRGRCMRAQALVEWNGVPADVDKLTELNRNTMAVRRSVVRAFQEENGLDIYSFDKKDEPHFNNKNCTAWVRGMGFTEKEWPSTTVGVFMDDDFLEDVARQHADDFPAIMQLRQLRKFLTIAKTKFKFAIGPDGRNRTWTKPFTARSSRSQPETSLNIPNATKPLRFLLKPRAGEVLMHRDWSNAEYGIAAALSGDAKRWDHYIYRDAYLVKAADFGFCDYTATKETHRELRNKFKPVVLAGQYGQTAEGLAKVLGISVSQAKAFQEKEAKLYPAYQRWLRDNEENMAFDHRVQTEFGWNLWIPKRPTRHDLRTAMNLPMQGNCAEIMRLTLCYATERGIDVGATIHDAFVYTAAADSWQDVDAEMKQCMDMACEDVIGEGYILKSDRHVVEYPDRYRDEDGEKMWNKIETALAQAEAPQEAATI
jgi:DNA polymerase I-like protein with 3'-5' exonuclease and polymerase domains